MPFTPRRVLVEEQARSYPLTSRILAALRGLPVEFVPSAESAAEALRSGADPIGRGKEILLLSVLKGPFIKPCPCSPGHVRCGYFIINLTLNCPLDCSYCILQGYLSSPFLTVHVNRDDLRRELDDFLGGRDRPGTVRIGTGELADSLALDALTADSTELIDYFRGKPGVVLELKTKSTCVERVLKAEAADNIVVSWSLNTAKAASAEERGSPPVAERLRAAAEVRSKGFRVGFHFDPLIRYPGWREDYRRVIEDLFRAVDPGGIAWISLGSLRFPPALKTIISRRFPASRLPGEELIRGRDGKSRYFRPLRVELYRHVLADILQAAGGPVPVYLCMESVEVWREVCKKNPGGKAALSSFLSSRR